MLIVSVMLTAAGSVLSICLSSLAFQRWSFLYSSPEGHEATGTHRCPSTHVVAMPNVHLLPTQSLLLGTYPTY